MPSKKRLQDLEYNVYKKDLDTHHSSDNLIGTKDTGCLTILAAIMVFVIVIVTIVGFMQVGKNGPALTCAAPGCSNRLKPGSNYCWLHSGSSNAKKSGGSSSSGGSSGSGSVIGGSSGSSETKPSRNKIWGGSGSNKNSGSSSSSGGGASSSGGGSSSGGSN